MDNAKCLSLKNEFASQTEPQAIPILRFFDGNDDMGSIGCNLVPHPGIDVFRKTLVGLLERPDVQAVYALIEELDPGEECWPFSDTVLIAGTISASELRHIVDPLQPDEIGNASDFGISQAFSKTLNSPALVLCWD